MMLDIKTVVNMIVAEKLLVGIEVVKSKARLVEDLGADSLNILEIILHINETFEIELSAEALIRVRKVEDLVQLVSQAFIQK